MYNIEPSVIMATIDVESSFNPAALSKDGGDYGLMQIRKRYVKETAAQLYDSCTNIRVGTRILSEAKRDCRHKEDYTYVVCYNAGVTGGSKLKYPKKFPYYIKFMEALKKYDKT